MLMQGVDLVMTITLLSCCGCQEQLKSPTQSLPPSLHAFLSPKGTGGNTPYEVSVRMTHYPILRVKPDPNINYPILRVKPDPNINYPVLRASCGSD
jgi:hypothetical protein